MVGAFALQLPLRRQPYLCTWGPADLLDLFLERSSMFWFPLTVSHLRFYVGTFLQQNLGHSLAQDAAEVRLPCPTLALRPCHPKLLLDQTSVQPGQRLLSVFPRQVHEVQLGHFPRRARHSGRKACANPELLLQGRRARAALGTCSDQPCCAGRAGADARPGVHANANGTRQETL